MFLLKMNMFFVLEPFLLETCIVQFFESLLLFHLCTYICFYFKREAECFQTALYKRVYLIKFELLYMIHIRTLLA